MEGKATVNSWNFDDFHMASCGNWLNFLWKTVGHADCH